MASTIQQGHGGQSWWPFKTKKLVIQDEQECKISTNGKGANGVIPETNGTNSQAGFGRTSANSIYPASSEKIPKLPVSLKLQNGSASTNGTAKLSGEVQQMEVIKRRLNQVKFEDSPESRLSQDLSICNGQTSIYLKYDPKSAEEELFLLADEDQPIVARCFPKGTHPDSQVWFEKERKMKHCLYPSSVYDEMLSNTLRDLGVLQSNLDQEIVRVRNTPPPTQEDIDEKLKSLNLEKEISNENEMTEVPSSTIPKKSPRKWFKNNNKS